MTFKKSLLAAAVAIGTSSAFAFPVFLPGQNQINFNSVENHYRASTACGVGDCLAADANDPTGYQRVDPSLTGAASVLAGDIFAGILYVYKLLPSNTAPSSAQEFTGYFAQQVSCVDAGSGCSGVAGAGLTNAIIQFANPTVDPFHILGSGEMFRLYTDSTPDYTIFGTTASTIATATDGDFWGALGIGSESFAYTRDDLTISGNDANFASKAYMALNVVTQGISYNLNPLNKVNDTSESQMGGVTVGNKLLCSPADLLNPAVMRSDIVGNADIKKNDWADTSPYYYEVNDPMKLNMVPEPGSVALVGLALAGLGLSRRRRSV